MKDPYGKLRARYRVPKYLNIQYILDRQDLFLREITEYEYKLQDAEKRENFLIFIILRILI